MAGCVWGHIFSPWLNFHGGKGIAVAIGALYVTFGFVPASVELFVIFAILVLATRYVSLGSVAAAAACPFIAAFLYWGDWLTILLYLAAASTVVWAHRGNIKRLLDGTERRIGDPKEE
jgi:glycerol-3-phosphate acyltransferase PlsY